MSELAQAFVPAELLIVGVLGYIAFVKGMDAWKEYRLRRSLLDEVKCIQRRARTIHDKAAQAMAAQIERSFFEVPLSPDKWTTISVSCTTKKPKPTKTAPKRKPKKVRR